MELDVRNESKTVTIWLTKAEKQDKQLQKELKLVYQSFKESGYLVAAFFSGDQDLTDATSGLVCYNRKRIAQLEVEQRRTQGFAINM